MRIHAIVTLVATAAALLACGPKSAGRSDATIKVGMGDTARAFTAESRSGRVFSLERPRARPLVLVFPGSDRRTGVRGWMHALRGIRADAGPFEFYALVDPAGRSGRDRGGPRRGGAGRGLGGDFGGGFDGGGITGRPTGAGATLAGGGDGGPQMLLDPDRDVSRRWVGVGSPDAVLFVISTDDVVQLVVTGEPSDASRRQISTIVRALQPDDDPR